MQAVVPAAGRGTRLRPLTDDRPKGLVEVAGRPLLSHCFDRLCAAGIAEIVVVIGDRGDQIVAHYGDSYRSASVQYVRQPEPRGLADAIARAEPLVDGSFLVCNGDNVFGCSLGPVLSAHRQANVDATLLVETATREQAATTGVVVTDDAGRVTEIVEKPDEPPSTLITTGVYALPAAMFDHCRAISPSDRGEYELAAALARLLDRGGTIATVPIDGWRVNVNTPADRERATRRLDASESPS